MAVQWMGLEGGIRHPQWEPKTKFNIPRTGQATETGSRPVATRAKLIWTYYNTCQECICCHSRHLAWISFVFEF
jgi:hypothetical protein